MLEIPTIINNEIYCIVERYILFIRYLMHTARTYRHYLHGSIPWGGVLNTTDRIWECATNMGGKISLRVHQSILKVCKIWY